MTCVKVRDYFARDKDSLGRCKCPTLEAIAVLGMPEAPTHPPTSIDTGCTGHCQVGPTSASSWASLLRRQTAQIGESSGQGAQGHHPSSANIDPIPIPSPGQGQGYRGLIKSRSACIRGSACLLGAPLPCNGNPARQDQLSSRVCPLR
ncbi:hypothetical protein CEP52_015112 [Fusarium oligoseptatum]|uniref:Uncharacterized protein n=1 Tax=Fusarium oligoseptatum TaxID=2604345 RepID=A0A428SG37_9HYPO|nr:hypothetical protein CEP52_015112 [Fusarium oligoseptatum]